MAESAAALPARCVASPAAPARLLDAAKYASAEYHGGLTAARAFSIAIDEAAKLLHPAAEPLIAYAALLAPEPIPLFLFSEGREKFGEPLTSDLAGDGLDEAVAALRAFALVDRETIADEACLDSRTPRRRQSLRAGPAPRLHRASTSPASRRPSPARWAATPRMKAVHSQGRSRVLEFLPARLPLAQRRQSLSRPSKMV